MNRQSYLYKSSTNKDIYKALLLSLLDSLVTGLFFPVLLLNQRRSPPLRLQASHCSTFRIMCDVPSIAVFWSESIECFPGIVSKCSFKLLVIIIIIIVRDKLQTQYGVRNINHRDEEEFYVGDVTRTRRNAIAQLAGLTEPNSIFLAALPNVLKCSSKHLVERWTSRLSFCRFAT